MTEIDVGHIIYDDCRDFGLPIYLKTTLPNKYEEHEDRIEESGRIVIRPKAVAGDKTYFNDCTVEVNIAFPNIEGEIAPSLHPLYKRALRTLNDDKCGRFEGEFYRYSVQRHGVEEDKNLNCYYANITLLFEILNVRR